MWSSIASSAVWRSAAIASTADILLDNTVRFADAGPVRVDLTVGAAALQFVVTDAGPGLDAGQRAQALAPFVRIESGGRLGVGLAIASRIAELGGGRLDLDDADGGGLRASIELPITTGPDGE